jgi:hypothetical protein
LNDAVPPFFTARGIGPALLPLAVMTQSTLSDE